VNILVCNSFLYERGGAETCALDHMDLLASRGHAVVPFAIEHPLNRPSPYSSYFASRVDYPSLLKPGTSPITRMRAAARVVYSFEARRHISRLIAETRPDVAHAHGIAHELSPSVLGAMRAAGVPVVQTLHDFKLLCPNTTFVSHGEICERCAGGRYVHAALRRCKRGSLAASGVAAIESYAHHALRLYERNVDVFLAPSRFLAGKLRAAGFRGRLQLLRHGIDTDRVSYNPSPDRYAVFVGRLVQVKGLRTLLQAVRSVRDLKLYVVGEGELRAELTATAASEGLTNVTFLGPLPRDEVLSLVREARFAVLPSEWYENSPMAILESLAVGTPVVATRIGALPELVEDGRTGLLVPPGDAPALARAMTRLLHDDVALAMRPAARRKVERDHDLEGHYRSLLAVYEPLVRRSRTAA
jgi:glycosyltransferase involved in cell wall biosynthesis